MVLDDFRASSCFLCQNQIAITMGAKKKDLDGNILSIAKKNPALPLHVSFMGFS